MLSRGTRRAVAFGVVVCLLLLGTLASPQRVTHAGHHAHHTATTHVSVLCSWLCAAGQALVGAAIVLNTDRGPVAHVAIVAVQEPAAVVPSTTPSRGPPSLSV